MRRLLTSILGTWFLVIVCVGISHATLTTIGTADYDSDGDGTPESYKLIYDDDNNGKSVVWLDYSNPKNTWDNQVAWAAGLNDPGVLSYYIDPGYSIDWGTNQWRLPSTVDGALVFGYEGDPDNDNLYTYTWGWNLANSEMGHLYYEALGNLGGCDTNNNCPQPDWGMVNTGDFDNIVAHYHWSGTEHSASPSGAWRLSTVNGHQRVFGKITDSYGLAVRTVDDDFVKGYSFKKLFIKILVFLNVGVIFFLIYFFIRKYQVFPSKFSKGALLCTISTILLFAGFFSNSWKVADQKWFDKHQLDSEYLVVSRIAQSNANGIFSYAGLLGKGKSNRYSPYLSTIGGQGLLFSGLEKLLPLPDKKKFRAHQAFTSLLSAFILSLIVLWFWEEFDLLVSLLVLCSLIFSQWLVVFGKNLYWVIWAFYLPMVSVMYYFKHYRLSIHWAPKVFGSIVFISVFTKCLFNGYSHITSTLVMMMVPFVYYSALYKLKLSTFLKGFITATISSFLAILLTFSILAFQISLVKGDFSAGVDHIAYTFFKRAHGGGGHEFAAVYKRSHDASLISVVDQYLNKTFFETSNYIPSTKSHLSYLKYKVSYLNLIYLFLLVSIYLILRRRIPVFRNKPRSDFSLVITTWFSILAPLSWFIMFKGHARIHGHIDAIVWQMPFTLFGFGLCGIGLKRVLSDLICTKKYILGGHPGRISP